MFNNTDKPKRTLLLILSFLVINSSFLNGAIRYVIHSGSNTPPYTSWATAADSIMSAINISVFGDTIYIANGVYKERVDMVDGLTFIGAGMDSCVIDTRNFPLTSPFYSIETGDSCYLSGIKVLSYDLNNGIGIRLKNSNIMYCTIKYAAIGMTINTGYQEKPMAYKNIILDVTDGITTLFAQSIIRENIIYARGNGLVSQVNSAPTYINNTIVCAPCWMGFNDFGLQSKLNNNIFYSISGGNYGLWTYGDAITNNIIYGAWGDGISGAS